MHLSSPPYVPHVQTIQRDVKLDVFPKNMVKIQMEKIRIHKFLKSALDGEDHVQTPRNQI
jgi:hypothetical protein